MIQPSTLISRGPSMVMTEQDGVVTLMNIDSARFYALNDSASELWRQLEAPRGFGELVARLADEYGAAPAAIAPDISGLLEEMQRIGAVVLGSD